MISKKAKYTFDALHDAAHEHRLILAKCTDRRTGKPAYVLCESFQKDGQVMFNPLARLFSGNPHNEVTPPGMDAPKLI